MIDDKVKKCWLNGVFISPTAVNTAQDVRLDVYNIEDGRLVVIRKGEKIFKQKTAKDKDLIYDTIYEAYKYYYNKL